MDATDLLVNGVAADSVTVVDSDTLQFSIVGANSGDGIYNVTIDANALTSVTGKFVEAFAASFDVEATSPVVTASSIVTGETLTPGTLVYEVVFSEPLAPEDLGPEDVLLTEQLSGDSLTPDGFAYDPDTATVTVTYNDLAEGNYELVLTTSDTAFRDRRGNLLDGDPSFPLPSGDGTPGDDFSLTFTADIDSSAYPIPLEPKLPLGSLIYDPQLSGVMNGEGDTDSFTVDLDADQLLTVVLAPTDVTLTPQIEIFAPDGTLLAGAVAAAGGETVVLQNIAASETGTYTIRAGSAAGVGRYELRLVLNAAVELETYGLGTDNELGTAQDLQSSLLDLVSGVSRGAVLGQADGVNFEDSQTQNANVFYPNSLQFDFVDAPIPAGDGTLTITVNADLVRPVNIWCLMRKALLLRICSSRAAEKAPRFRST